LLLVVAVCGIAATIYLPPLATGFWPRLWAFAGSIFTALYAAIWIVGDRRNLKEGGHRITNDALIVDLGIRCSGVIALDSIAACRKLEQGERHSAASDAWIVSPGEAANVLIELDGMTTLEIMTWGWPRQVSKRFVALYVDEPDLFVHAVSQACGRARNAVA
jgi:hypothetical protein